MITPTPPWHHPRITQITSEDLWAWRRSVDVVGVGVELQDGKELRRNIKTSSRRGLGTY